MGGVSSVYIRPVPTPATATNHAQSAVSESVTETGSQIVQWQLQQDGNPGGGVLEMKIVSADREAELGRTIQFLAEENVRLRRMNDSLKLQDVNESNLIQPDLFDESLEEKVKRLEKTLILEREEKWAAIASGELCRVNLINCQGLLTQEEEKRKGLEVKLKALEDENHRLKMLPDSVEFAVNRTPALGSDLQTFRQQMQQLREARHKAIAAKSEEMMKLREDLACERARNERLDRKLSNFVSGNLNESLNEREKEELDHLKALRDENTHLSEILLKMKMERTQFSAKCLQLENDLSEARRKCERARRDFRELEMENERLRLNDVGDGESSGDFVAEREDMLKQMVALRDIARISRQMLEIRQNQVDDLKVKLNVIEETVKRSRICDGGELKAEYEKQLENIKSLKELYEERVRLMETERTKLLEKIATDSKATEDLKNELSDLSIKYDMAADEADQERQKTLALEQELANCVAQAQNWHRELTCINSLLTQMLLGPNPETPEHLDRLVELLQQNHELIAQITNCEDCNDVAAALPKLLLDLITQMEDREKRELIAADVPVSMTDSTDTISEQSGALPIVSYKNAKVFKEPVVNQDELEFVMPSSKVNPAVQEIVTNLPKVWKVLTELLSHHSLVERQPGEPQGQERTCYKRIETPNGPRSVISVSNTFIRLKELILEKKSLTQEVCRLRHLNSHLETRLEDQEKRLSSVQSELHKTWGVVGRMRAQHQQLHNHEKILRYELQEKRIMLSELREELEHCKDKWERARRKNNESEAECRKLRKEFAARKFHDLGLTASRDSGESGFSDDQCDADRSSTPSPIDFRTRSDAQTAGNDVSVDGMVEEMSTGTGQWVDIGEEDSGGGAVALDEELRVNVCPLEEQLAPVEEEPGGVEGEATVEDRARDAKALRLQRLEEQCALLVRKVDITTHKSNFLSNRLEELHDHYGGGAGSSTQEEVGDSVEVQAGEEQVLEESNPLTVEVLSEDMEVPASLPLSPLGSQPVTVDGRLVARDERLRLLETDRGAELSAKLTEIHEGCVNAESLVGVSAVLNESAVAGESSVQKSDTGEESTLSAEVIPMGTKAPPIPPPLPADPPGLTLDERLAARDERLRRLEADCSDLCGKVGNTVNRGVELSAKLTEIHEGCVNAEKLLGVSEVLNESAVEEALSVQESDAGEELTLSADVIPVGTKAPPIPPPLPAGTPVLTLDERLAARDERLRRLEADCSDLCGKVGNTVNRGVELSAKLTEIHEGFVSSESTASYELNPEETKAPPTPPPLPADPHQLTLDERLAARDERLRRLEAECSSLCGKVGNTVNKGNELSAKLTEIHEGCVNTENRITVASSFSETAPEEEIILDEGVVVCESAASGALIPEETKASPTPPPLPADPQQLTWDERLAARDERLRRLEAECSSLCGKVGNTVNRGNELSAKLTEIHEGCVNTETRLNVASSTSETPPEDVIILDEGVVVGESAASDGLIPEETKAPPTPPPLPADPQQLTLDERLAARGERLRRLEAECSSLCGKVGNTVNRGSELSAKLTEIHEGCVNTENRLSVASSTSETSPKDVKILDEGVVVGESAASGALIPEETKAPPTPPPLPADPQQLTLDERLAARGERLRRLEAECSSLCGKVGNTVIRGNELSAKLTEIHEGCVSTENRLSVASSTSETSPEDVIILDEGVAVGESAASDGLIPEETKAPPTPPPLPADPQQLTLDERLAARDERLRRLEAECSSLCGKVGNTVNRGNELSAKLTEIHEGCVNTENRLAAASTSKETEPDPKTIPEKEP